MKERKRKKVLKIIDIWNENSKTLHVILQFHNKKQNLY